MKRCNKIISGMCMLCMALVMVVMCSVNADAAATLSKKKATLYVGETLQLKLTGGGKRATWKSNGTKVASVSKNGLVTAKKTGVCKITVTQNGKKYTCKISVKKLPKKYAIVNGKRVKVGKTVTLKYMIQSKKPISGISIKYMHDTKSLKITNEEAMNRYPAWICNSYFPDSIDEDGKSCIYSHLASYDETRTDGLYEKNITCKKPVVFEVMKVKACKTGNYKIEPEVYGIRDEKGNSIKGYKVTYTIK